MTDNNIESKLSVEVFEVVPESIECEDSIDLIVGGKDDYKINIIPENVNNKVFKISCDNECILKYSESSLQAISEGKTVLHIETWNCIKKDISVNIDIFPVEKIEIKDTTNYAHGGVESSIKITVIDRNLIIVVSISAVFIVVAIIAFL